MALLAGLVGATSALVRSTVDGAAIASSDLQTAALVRAGIELAGYQLYGLKQTPVQVHAQQVRFDAGVITLFVSDEGGKVDLNGSPPELLAGAYRAAGLKTLTPASFAARVIDWRDEDAKPSTGGAEAPEYAAAGLSYRPQNDAFRSINDLQWLLGISPTQIPALSDVLTIHNPDGKVNVMNATREILLAIPGISPGTVERISSIRKGNPVSREKDLITLLQEQKEFIKIQPGPAFRVRVEARLSTGRKKSVEVVLIPSRSDDSLYFISAWVDQEPTL
jgi:general secretion pathway protein K